MGDVDWRSAASVRRIKWSSFRRRHSPSCNHLIIEDIIDQNDSVSTEHICDPLIHPFTHSSNHLSIHPAIHLSPPLINVNSMEVPHLTDDVTIPLDRHWFQRIIRNILNNAIYWMVFVRRQPCQGIDSRATFSGRRYHKPVKDVTIDVADVAFYMSPLPKNLLDWIIEIGSGNCRQIAPHSILPCGANLIPTGRILLRESSGMLEHPQESASLRVGKRERPSANYSMSSFAYFAAKCKSLQRLPLYFSFQITIINFHWKKYLRPQMLPPFNSELINLFN